MIVGWCYRTLRALGFFTFANPGAPLRSTPGLPLLPLQILWINLVTDIFPDLALALEPTAPGVMEHRPLRSGYWSW
jgi:magnesium-transporting ATPase (P-type)